MASDAAARRPGIGAWLAFAPLAVWLLALVLAPTLILVAFSFCDRDDFGTPVWQFTLDNYRQIFDPELMPVFLRTGTCAVTAAAIATVAIAVTRRRFSTAAIRYGLLLGGVAFLACVLRRPPAVGAHGLRFLPAPLPSESGVYLRLFWRSGQLAGLTTLLCLLAGYPVAFFIGRCGPVWRGRLLLAVMIPFWTSFLIRTYAWITILNQTGLLNGLLRAVRLGVLIPASGAFLYTPTAVVIGLVYAYLPFMILPIYGSVERLDPSLIEASLDLGAGPWRTLMRVVLPLTTPGIAAGVLLVFVPAIAMFAVTDLMGGGGVLMIGNVIEEQFTHSNNQPFGAALGVTLMALFALVFLATGRQRPAAA